MKNITNNTEEIRSANGGGKWNCRFCSYSRNSYWDVYWHIIAHAISWIENL